MSTYHYYVDEAGDGVLFGPKGRDRLRDADANQFFMLGMIHCEAPEIISAQLAALRASVMTSPLYAGIPSLQPKAEKTARAFHAKDDHPEIRAKMFELLTTLEFRFFAVIKDMRKVRDYVGSRNRMNPEYRHRSNRAQEQPRFHRRRHSPITFQSATRIQRMLLHHRPNRIRRQRHGGPALRHHQDRGEALP